MTLDTSATEDPRISMAEYFEKYPLAICLLGLGIGEERGFGEPLALGPSREGGVFLVTGYRQSACFALVETVLLSPARNGFLESNPDENSCQSESSDESVSVNSGVAKAASSAEFLVVF